MKKEIRVITGEREVRVTLDFVGFKYTKEYVKQQLKFVDIIRVTKYDKK